MTKVKSTKPTSSTVEKKASGLEGDMEVFINFF